jgi:hypothetical protein
MTSPHAIYIYTTFSHLSPVRQFFLKVVGLLGQASN